MVQRPTAAIALLLLFITYKTKLDIALHIEERAVPASISLTEVARPPIFARKITETDTRNAPINAITPT